MTMKNDKFENMMKVYGMSFDWELREVVIRYKEEDRKKPEEICESNSVRMWLAFYYNTPDKCRSARV
jgi:hypothetical protein